MISAPSTAWIPASTNTVRRAWLSTRPLSLNSSSSRPITVATASMLVGRRSTASLVQTAVSDPDTLFLAGSSAGAHLTAMAALTANDPTFQPGFEASDTSVSAGITLYGYYGQLGGDEHPPSTPLAYVRPEAPPFFVVHGDNDTYAPVEGARLLVERLRAASPNPGVYTELPGAQHSFDLFHSVRFEMVVDAIETFAAWVRTQHDDGGAHAFEAGAAAL